MSTNRCLAHTYVIYKVSTAWLQLRQLAQRLHLWTPASADNTCSLLCSSSFTWASSSLYSDENEEEEIVTLVGEEEEIVTWVGVEQGAWLKWAWPVRIDQRTRLPPECRTHSGGFQCRPSARERGDPGGGGSPQQEQFPQPFTLFRISSCSFFLSSSFWDRCPATGLDGLWLLLKILLFWVFHRSAYRLPGLLRRVWWLPHSATLPW